MSSSTYFGTADDDVFNGTAGNDTVYFGKGDDSFTSSGTTTGFDSIFGGQGSMFGSMVGLFIPATLQSGFVIIGVSPYWQTVAVGAILIAAVFVDQQRRAAASRGKGV